MEDAPHPEEQRFVIQFPPKEPGSWLRYTLSAVAGLVLLTGGYVVARAVGEAETRGLVAQMQTTQSQLAVSIKELVNATAALETRVTRIEASRFTAEDGLRAWQEIAKIRERLDSLPPSGAPKWLEDAVTGITTRLDRLEDRLERLENK